ncbi:DUF533 domain-containing protein [Acidovorax lacteus]|uniref:GTPase n=1 Tax=Acidovorax lacteus TaxID=1924988 RepID=A0ABP8KYB4_9BURK
MTPDQQRALLTIALHAAFADGRKDDAEREEIRRIAESLALEGQRPDLTRLVQDVLLQRAPLEASAALLQEGAHRHLAYEMAVCVCDVDGQQSDGERAFLARLRPLLGLDAQEAATLQQQPDALAAAADAMATPYAHGPAPAPSPAASPAAGGLGGWAAAAGAAAAAAAGLGMAKAGAPAPLPPEATTPSAALASGVDKTILNYAILTGALELLPQSWASMAIIPLQIKLVHSVGKAYGVELDQGHIKEFIAAAGVGITSQYLEQFGRKLLGGLLGQVAGRTGARIGSAATGMAFSFATTYALGQVAQRYYAGGRTMSTALLRQTFQDLLGPARDLQPQYLSQIREKAATLDAAQVMAMVRGR